MKTNNLNTIIKFDNINDKENYNRYIIEIGKWKALSREEEIKTFKLIEGGDKSAIEKICQHNLLFVIRIAKKYGQYLGTSALTLEDLISEGNIGLHIAILKFDYRTGNKFISYAVWWIKSLILASIQSNIKSIKVPSNIRKIFNQINKKENIIEQRLGRAPSTTEILEAMLEDISIDNNINEKKIEEIKFINKFETSLDSFINEDEESIEFNQLIVCDDDGPEDQFICKERNNLIVGLLDGIPYHIQETIKDFYGIDRKPLNYTEIGLKYNENAATIKMRIDRWIRHIRRNQSQKKSYFLNTNEYSF